MVFYVRPFIKTPCPGGVRALPVQLVNRIGIGGRGGGSIIYVLFSIQHALEVVVILML